MKETDLDINSLYAWSVGYSGKKVPFFELNDRFEHEGIKWYQLKVYSGVIGGWIEAQDEELWWENTPEWKDTRSLLLYTVHEKLYTWICLRWNNG